MNRSFAQCLLSRRSIRRFTAASVSRDTIRTLLEQAILAPSASNLQPWRFIVVDERELVQKIRSFSPGIGGEPPCLIVCCLDLNLLPKGSDGEPCADNGILDLAMAAENFMLAAVEQGLGTCVIRSFHPKLVKRILHLPENISPEFLLTLGYPDCIPRMPRRRPVEEITTYNAWEVETSEAGF